MTVHRTRDVLLFWRNRFGFLTIRVGSGMSMLFACKIATCLEFEYKKEAAAVRHYLYDAELFNTRL